MWSNNFLAVTIPELVSVNHRRDERPVLTGRTSTIAIGESANCFQTIVLLLGVEINNDTLPASDGKISNSPSSSHIYT